MAKSADRYFQMHPDKIEEIGYDPSYALESESVFSLANEHMGVRGFFDEGGGETLRGVYLGGVYEKQPYRQESNYLGFVQHTHYMPTAADCLYTSLCVADETLDLAACDFTEYVRSLRFSDGVLTRSFCWHTKRAGASAGYVRALAEHGTPAVDGAANHAGSAGWRR